MNYACHADESAQNYHAVSADYPGGDAKVEEAFVA